jgi:hypothetical protein
MRSAEPLAGHRPTTTVSEPRADHPAKKAIAKRASGITTGHHDRHHHAEKRSDIDGAGLTTAPPWAQ